MKNKEQHNKPKNKEKEGALKKTKAEINDRQYSHTREYK